MDSLRKKTPPVAYYPQQETPVINSPYTHTVRPLPSSTRRSLSQDRPRSSRIITKLFIVLCLSLFFWGGYFSWKMYRVGQSVEIVASIDTQTGPTGTLKHIQAIASSFLDAQSLSLKGANDGRINILLLGKSGEHYSGRDLTDTIMIMSIDTKAKKMALLSLPRDLYVRIPDTQTFTKINALYQYGNARNQGTEYIEKTITDITGLPIQYTFIIDFSGFERVIDTIGGIHVEVVRDIRDTSYPGPGFSYETFELSKGWHSLDGATALKYVRERHNDPEGDFGRAKRQQQVIQAVKNKVFSLQTFLNAFTLNNLLTVLGESVQTNIAPEEINGFIEIAKQIDTVNITNVVIDAWKPESLLRVSHVMIGDTRMFILVPRIGSYAEIRDTAATLFSADTIQRRKSALATEKASIAIINRSTHPQLTEKMHSILTNGIGFSNVSIISDSTAPVEHGSFIIDRSGQTKPFTLDELLKKFPLTVGYENGLSALPQIASENDLIIVLGEDIGTTLNFEEDSLQEWQQSEENVISYPPSTP